MPLLQDRWEEDGKPSSLTGSEVRSCIAVEWRRGNRSQRTDVIAPQTPSDLAIQE